MTLALEELTTPRRTTEALGMLPTMLARALGPDYRIRALDHRPSSSRSTFAIEEIDVLLTNGDLLRLVLKSVGPKGLLPNVRMAKPLFLHDPLREIEFQQHVLSDRPELGTPLLYSTVVEPACDRFWLLSERIAGSTLDGVANLERWRSAARWLARMHVALAPLANEPLARGTMRLLLHGGDLLRMWIGRALTVVPVQEPFMPRDLMLGLQRLAQRYDSVVDRLLSMPRTVIHGEFFGSNILVRSGCSIGQISVVDWDMVALGAPLMDLAALTAGERDGSRRRELALTYRAALGESPLASADETEFLRDLEFCRLHLAIQWLGWSPDSPPPRTQAHRWIEDILEIADRLDV